jgi:predicted nucleic acid-binding protein
MIVLFDAGPLGLPTNPKGSDVSRECTFWLERLVDADHLVMIPEVADYELRREFLRARMTRALGALDRFGHRFVFVPITTPAMRRAAELWAAARQRGMPTADDSGLDVDMILAAQAIHLEEDWQQEVVIATTNVRHLTRFAAARLWQEVG